MKTNSFESTEETAANKNEEVRQVSIGKEEIENGMKQR